MRFDLAEQLQEAWVQNFTCLIARLKFVVGTFCWAKYSAPKLLPFQPNLSSGRSSRLILDWSGIAHATQSPSEVNIWDNHVESDTSQTDVALWCYK